MPNADLSALVAHTTDDLIWSPRDQMGFYDVDAHLAREGIPLVYAESYFQKYVEMDQTTFAEDLNRFRCITTIQAMPDHVKPIRVLDVGIGGGGFINALLKRQDIAPARLDVYGADINPIAINWLENRKMLGSFDEMYDVVTFWDSLEHIRYPETALQCVGTVAIVSIPIFRDAEHALASKHYRKDEHFWYFTRQGFIKWAGRMGFIVQDVRITETLLGREDIETFVLRRKY